MGLHQTKSFYIAKEIISNIKGQPMTWEKVSTNHIAGTGLMSKIYKNLTPLNTTTTTKTIQGKNGQKN